MRFDYPFSSEELLAAMRDWNCNCGPSALAFALQVGLDKIRGKIPGFDQKGYTSPSMMSEALYELGKGYLAIRADDYRPMFNHRIALVRVQWHGPWTAPGANPKWAYRQTHWIATWEDMEERGIEGRMEIFNRVFDCNTGICSFDDWQKFTVPLILKGVPRADGKWSPTHIWRLLP